MPTLTVALRAFQTECGAAWAPPMAGSLLALSRPARRHFVRPIATGGR